MITRLQTQMCSDVSKIQISRDRARYGKPRSFLESWSSTIRYPLCRTKVNFYCLFMRGFGAISSTVDRLARTALMVRSSEFLNLKRLLVIISWFLACEKNKTHISCV